MLGRVGPEWGQEGRGGSQGTEVGQAGAGRGCNHVSK